MDSKLSIRQYRGRSGFAEIRGAWHELMRSVSFQCFYHHPAWFQAYFDRPDVREDMYFRCAYDGKRLVAVFPLYYRQRLGGVIREARFPDYDGLYMPDMAVSDELSLPELWRVMSGATTPGIAPMWDVFAAGAVLDQSAVARALLPSDDDIVTSSPEGKCAVFDIRQYDEMLRQLKKKFRGNLNNAKHKLSAEQDVSFKSVVHENELQSAFDEFVVLEQAGWKGKPETMHQDYPRPAAIGLKKSKHLFYRNVVREFGKLGLLQILLLKIRGRTISAQINILLNDFCYVLKTAFDESFSRLSPGHLVLDFAFRQFSETGGVRHICMITDYDWFKYWNPRYMNYLRINAFRKTVRGRAISAAHALMRH